MEIKILGPGCKKCTETEKVVQKALEELDVNAEVEKVEEADKIASYNILMTPGVVINGKVKVFGKVPKHKDIVRYIQEEV
ncbi:MAG: thioredoxin family protein [Clostridiales bacterium]|nr:thioredoxin family protein [Clostridiales bacterium]MCF8023005.1 thioredoxin family protein [Clostridiales bacterium]